MPYPPFAPPAPDQTIGTDDQVSRYAVLKNRVANLHDEISAALRADQDVVTATRQAQQFREPHWAGDVEDLAAVLLVELWYARHGEKEES